MLNKAAFIINYKNAENMQFKITIYFYNTISILIHFTMWFSGAKLSALLLQSSVSDDPSKIIIIC